MSALQETKSQPNIDLLWHKDNLISVDLMPENSESYERSPQIDIHRAIATITDALKSFRSPPHDVKYKFMVSHGVAKAIQLAGIIKLKYKARRHYSRRFNANLSCDLLALKHEILFSKKLTSKAVRDKAVKFANAMKEECYF